MNLVIGERVEMAAGGQENHSGVVAARGDIIPSQPGPVRTAAARIRGSAVSTCPSRAFYDKNWVVYILLPNTFVKLLLIAGGKNPVKHSLIWVSGCPRCWLTEESSKHCLWLTSSKHNWFLCAGDRLSESRSVSL